MNKLIYAEKESGPAVEKDGSAQYLDDLGDLELVEEYGGHYDKVKIMSHPSSGRTYQIERFPAASQAYVTHIYAVVDEPVEEIRNNE